MKNLNTEKNQEVESFKLDHTKVKAPFVRLSETLAHPLSSETFISKFDVRLTQPNKEFVSSPAMHTLEHLLDLNIRKHLTNKDDLIDISPMGCRTGFYCTFFNKYDPKEMVGVLTKAFNDIIITDTLPDALKSGCNNIKEHDLENAKIYAKRFVNFEPSLLIDVYKEKLAENKNIVVQESSLSIHHISKQFQVKQDPSHQPCIKKAKVFSNIKDKDAIVTKLDIKLTDSKNELISNASIHTLEHLLANNIRKYTPSLIDISPMGSRTGFRCLLFGEDKLEKVSRIIDSSFENVLLAKNIPGATEEECGNYLEHDLRGAKMTANNYLESKSIHRMKDMKILPRV